MVDEQGRMRGKTHHAQTWAVSGHGHGPRPYRLVEASSVPDRIWRCSFCGGGR